eukprot:11560710-Ditylum_brightwellii.AAC.1
MESLVVPFEMMRHGIHVEMVQKTLEGDGAIYVDEEHLLFEWDEEKIFWTITKPNEEDMEVLETFELNSPIHEMAVETGVCQRKRTWRTPIDIPVGEWRKHLAMLPEAV